MTAVILRQPGQRRVAPVVVGKGKGPLPKILKAALGVFTNGPSQLGCPAVPLLLFLGRPVAGAVDKGHEGQPLDPVLTGLMAHAAIQQPILQIVPFPFEITLGVVERDLPQRLLHHSDLPPFFVYHGLLWNLTGYSGAIHFA